MMLGVQTLLACVALAGVADAASHLPPGLRCALTGGPDDPRLVVYGEVVATGGDERPWARLRLLYRWRGVAEDTVSVRTGPVDDPGLAPGEECLVLAEPVPAAAPPWPRFFVTEDCVVRGDGLVLPFYRLGRPAWIRPGEAWLDLTPDDLVAIGRRRGDTDLVWTGLEEQDRVLDPTAHAERLVAAWRVGPSWVRVVVARLVRAFPRRWGPDGRALLHHAALDGLGAPDAATRGPAADLLGALGVATPVTRAALERLAAHDPDPGVRRAAAAARDSLAGER